LGIFGINSFLKRISEILEIFGRFDVVLKIGRCTPNSCSTTWGAVQGFI